MSSRLRRGQSEKVSGPLGLGKKGTLSRRLSERIDSLIEGHLARNIPKNLNILGLDDKDGEETGRGNLFGHDGDDFEVISLGSLAKSAKSPRSLKPQ